MQKSEKRYLLNDKIKPLIKDLAQEPSHSEKFYTKIKLCKETFYNKEKNRYTKTNITGVDNAQSIEHREINKQEFQSAKRTRIGKVLHIYTYKLKEAKLLQYKKSLDGLYILKLSKENDQNSLDQTLQEYIVQDISDDSRYSDKNLALLGNPLKDQYNIYSIFKDLELERTQEIEEYIFKEMTTSDAVRIKLFWYLQRFKKEKEKLLQNPHNEEALENIRTYLTKSKIFLNDFSILFEKAILQKIDTHLEMMINLTKKEKDLRFIQKTLKELYQTLQNHQLLKLIERVDEKIAAEELKISKFFTTREFAIIYKQYELLLKESNKSYFSYDAQVSIAYSLAQKIKTRHKKLLQLCHKYNGCNNDESYQKVQKEFYRFQTIHKMFQTKLYDKKFLPLQKQIEEILQKIELHKETTQHILVIESVLKEFTTLTKKEKEQLNQRREQLGKREKELEKEIEKALDLFKNTSTPTKEKFY